MLIDALRLGTFGLFSAMGGWVLYTDFRFQKIRNNVLLWGLGLAAAAYAAALAATLTATVGAPVLGETFFTRPFYPALLAHVALSCAAALALWNLKIWPAGDAKLFALFSLLLPLASVDLPGFPSSLFLTCMINVFLPPAFFILARAIWWGLGQRAAAVETVQGWLKTPGVVQQALLHQTFYVSYYMTIFWLRDLLPANQSWISPLLGLAVMFAVGKFQQATRRGAEAVLPVFLAGALWMLVHYGVHAALVAVGRGLEFALTVGLASELAYAYLSRQETRTVPVADLKPYQVLAPQTLDEMRKDIVFLGENFNLTYKDGIQPSQLPSLQEWLGKRGIASATIYNTTPFAPWIVLGFCLTVLLRHDIAWMMRPDTLLPLGVP